MTSPAGLDDRYDDPDQLRDQVRLLLRYRATLVLGVLLGLLGGLLLVVLRAGTYTSASEVLVRPRTDPFSTFGLAVDNQVSMATERQIALSATVADRAATALRQPSRADALSADLRVTNAPDTQVLRFEYTGNTAKGASRVTNAFAEAYLADRQERSKSMIRRMSSGLEQQLTALTKRLNAKKPGGPAPGTAGIQQQISSLQKRMSDIRAYDTSGGDIVRSAEPAARPSGPGPGWLIPLGLIAGLALGIVLAWLRSALEPRARSVGEVQGALSAPVLGILPAPAADGELMEFGRADASRAEAYRALAFRLRGDGRTATGTLMVVAPKRERGAEAVAVNLAAALAESGDDVLLVDATGQTSGLSARLPLSADAAPDGVPEGAVVVDAGPAGRFTLCGDGRGAPGDDKPAAPTAARTLPPTDPERPTLFLGAPLLEHPEGLSLAQRVDGVLVVGALGDTKRDDLKQLRELIDCAGGHLAGVALHNGAGRGLFRRVMDSDRVRRTRKRIPPTTPPVAPAPSTPADDTVDKPTAPVQDDTLAASR
ncbi:Capsular polysaccharide biosynthesis protein [Streptomyces sp. cf386]|uniref:hypothetical protein n=1 Tax=Streptomyces sp. cf386 TaxID=1761904 RepID=UPI00088AC81B|nr:hypothetical protein [Streptomyces sp. cf386]SDN06059.1 Capsular polysaccharide biosynthesis protein [Streptomyces sp. cf386]